MSHPIEKMKQFMEWYPEAAEVKTIMWSLLEAAMASPNADTWSADYRSNMMFFYSQIDEFMSAAYVIAPPLLQIFHCSEINE